MKMTKVALISFSTFSLTLAAVRASGNNSGIRPGETRSSGDFAALSQARRETSLLHILEGVVVSTETGASWYGISVESAQMRYLIELGGKTGTITTQGDVQTPGNRVRVTYKGRPEPLGSEFTLNAVSVVQIKGVPRTELSNGSGRSSIPRNRTESPAEVARKEGERIMHSYFDDRLLQCGDSWWWVDRYQSCGKKGCAIQNKLHQAKGSVRFVFDGRYTPPKTLSTAERLNGSDPQPVEYEGIMSAILEASRCRNCIDGSDNQWSDNYHLRMGITERHGQWMISEFSDPYMSLRKPTCASNGNVLYSDEYLTPKTRFNGDYHLKE